MGSYALLGFHVARRRHLSDTDFAISIGPLPAMAVMGLDGPTIEYYPKTVLGQSMRLPKPSGGTCPICLYVPVLATLCLNYTYEINCRSRS